MASRAANSRRQLQRHPSYKEMILTAVRALKGDTRTWKGASRRAIAKHIAAAHSATLSTRHEALLSRHLATMASSGLLHRVGRHCYALPGRGRGEPRDREAVLVLPRNARPPITPRPRGSPSVSAGGAAARWSKPPDVSSSFSSCPVSPRAVDSRPRRHPTYKEMILTAVLALKGDTRTRKGKGVSRWAIAKHIAAAYSATLSARHPALLSRHLAALAFSGLLCRVGRHYFTLQEPSSRPLPPSATPHCLDPALPPLRGRAPLLVLPRNVRRRPQLHVHGTVQEPPANPGRGYGGGRGRRGGRRSRRARW